MSKKILNKLSESLNEYIIAKELPQDSISSFNPLSLPTKQLQVDRWENKLNKPSMPKLIVIIYSNDHTPEHFHLTNYAKEAECA